MTQLACQTQNVKSIYPKRSKGLHSPSKQGFKPSGLALGLACDTPDPKSPRMQVRNEITEVASSAKKFRQVYQPIWQAIEQIFNEGLATCKRPIAIVVRVTTLNNESISKVMKTFAERMQRKGARMHYVWCREIRSHDYEGVACDYEHYHVICILDKSVHTLAKFYAICTDLQRAGWLDSFHLSKDAGSIKVHDLKTVEGYQEAKWHASYIAKVETKVPTPGRRLYSHSKINHHDLMPLPTKHRLKPLNDHELDGEIDFIQEGHVDDLNHLATKNEGNTQTTAQHKTATSAVFLCREEMKMTDETLSESNQPSVKHGKRTKPDSERYRYDRTGNEIDWNLIEGDYIAGILSIRAIASSANIADVTVRRKAALEGWERHLAPRVLAEAQNLLMRDIGKENESAQRKIQKKSSTPFSNEGVRSLQAQALRARGESASSHVEDDEQDEFNAPAQRIRNVLHAHRQDIAKSRKVVKDLLNELQTDSPFSIQELLEIALNDSYDEATRKMCLAEAIDRTVNLGRRASAARDLMSALKMVITLERQALRINEMSINMSLPAVPVSQPSIMPMQFFDELFAKVKGVNI